MQAAYSATKFALHASIQLIYSSHFTLNCPLVIFTNTFCYLLGMV